MENLIITREYDDKGDWGKQRINYIVTLNKWMREQGLGELIGIYNLLRWGGQYIVESHGLQNPEGKQRIEENAF